VPRDLGASTGSRCPGTSAPAGPSRTSAPCLPTSGRCRPCPARCRPRGRRRPTPPPPTASTSATRRAAHHALECAGDGDASVDTCLPGPADAGDVSVAGYRP
jgi:hypothetical protein